MSATTQPGHPARGIALLGTAGVCSIQAYHAHTACDRVRAVLDTPDSFGAIRKLSHLPKPPIVEEPLTLP